MEEKKSVKKKIDKKTGGMILGFLLLIILFIILLFLKKGTEKNHQAVLDLEDSEILAIGEEKYLEFLWIVDGAFNDERFDKTISVNGKVIEDNRKKFTCKYENDKKTCKGINFEEAFSNVFVSSIKYDDVYGDGLAFKWYDKRGNDFYFKNMNSCNEERMSSDQKIELFNKSGNELIFRVTYTDNISAGIYKGTHEVKKDFVLVKEESEWKVSRAYYHDPCFMDYNISYN